MTVVYASPNRSHHFRYAEGLEAEGLLACFVQGYPRLKKAPLNVDSSRVMRRDALQTLYVPCFRWGNNHPITHFLNLASKDSIDAGLCRAMRDARIGLFYNGCGLKSIRSWRGKGKVFVCEAVNAHLDYQSNLLREECARLKIPFEEPYGPERLKRLAEYEESDYILCPSQFVAKSFEQMGIPSHRLQINPFGIPSGNSECGVPISSNQPNRFRILYVGSINFRKGLRYLIEAFDRLKAPGKELHLVGPRLPPDGISDLHLPDGITFHGVLRGEALAAAYRNADVFVQPSIEEGLSLVIGEALGHGLPVIATNHTGVEEMFANGECGFHVPIRDPEAIGHQLAHLLEEPALRHQLSTNALRKSREFGGWSVSQQSLCQHMRTLLAGLSHD